MQPDAEYSFSDYPLKDVRNFAAGGGQSLLWPEATTFLIHRGAYLRPEANTVACGQRPQGLKRHISFVNPIRISYLYAFWSNASRHLTLEEVMSVS